MFCNFWSKSNKGKTLTRILGLWPPNNLNKSNSFSWKINIALFESWIRTFALKNPKKITVQFFKKKNCWFIKKASLISFNLIQGFRYFQFNRNAPHNLRVREPEGIRKRCFDTVFGRPYRCFLITLKVILSLSDRYKLFTSDWIWIEVCQNAVFSKIDIFMTTINKKLYM